ncbi:MAG: sensor histidine kinase, partial [Roseovarius sp.]
FLESINHEIRTPLNAIVGLSSLLKDTAVLDEGRKEHVTLIHDAGLKIAEMMEKSERLVCLRSDDRLEALTTENIPELVADVAWQFFRNDPDRHVRVQSEKEINARVSKDLLRTALAELLDNVQKYTPKGSSVDVSVQEVGEQIVISMEDNGPGFDPERLGEMGNDFLRLNHGHGTIRGLGIGLIIAMETMLRVGGRLEIRNREQGGAVQALLIPKS